MTAIELPCLTIDAVGAIVATSRPLLANRDPGPGEGAVPLTSTIALEVVDPDPDGIDHTATRIWVDEILAFDGATTPAFSGSRANVVQTADTLRVVLDPASPFASNGTVRVHVVSRTLDATAVLDETYSFTAEDRTAPRAVAGLATGPRTVRIGFDEAVTIADHASLTAAPLDAPAVPVTVIEAHASGTLVELALDVAMTPGARYRVELRGIADTARNVCAPPFDRVVVTGFRPPRPPARTFDLWSMLPKHNRRADATGDLARFVACLQEIVDLLLADIDRFPDIFDLERAPAPFLDMILRDLGDPFAFDLDELGKRRLAAVLVQMYQQKGTAIGVRNVVRFFLGFEVTTTPLAATALVLGESTLDEDWELGPSDRFARYAFDVAVDHVLTSTERARLRAIVDYLKPAHTHFVNLIEPLAPIEPDHWEIGVSELGSTSILH